MKRLRRSPALALFLIAPLAELITGSMPPLEYFNPFGLILMPLLYGCGALLAREMVVRWGKGWFSLLLLGAAYGIYEEGIVVRSFFDPNWMDLGTLGIYGRASGVNWVWAAHLTQFHALVSIVSSVVIVELLYPNRRRQPWLSRRMLRWSTVGLLSWLVLGPVLNPYTPPSGWYALTWIAIGLLIWLAKRIPARPFPPRTRSVPRPRRFWWLGFAGMTGYFLFVYNVAENNSLSPPVLITLLGMLDGVVLWLALRWSGNGYAWNDRHKMALVAGGLWLFVFFGFILEADGIIGMSLVSVALLVSLEALARQVRRHEETVPRPTHITSPLPTWSP